MTVETKDIITLVAAVVAGVASSIALIVNLRAQRSTELRLAHRKSLEPYITELGQLLHEIIATSRILPKTKSEKAWRKWRDLGTTAQRKLKDLRPKLRYQLWGLDDGLRVFTRIPDWADHMKDDSSRSREFESRAQRLLRALDVAIQRSYRAGRPPNLIEHWRIKWHSHKCQEIFARGRTPQPSENERLEELFGPGWKELTVSSDLSEQTLRAILRDVD